MTNFRARIARIKQKELSRDLPAEAVVDDSGNRLVRDFLSFPAAFLMALVGVFLVELGILFWSWSSGSLEDRVVLTVLFGVLSLFMVALVTSRFALRNRAGQLGAAMGGFISYQYGLPIAVALLSSYMDQAGATLHLEQASTAAPQDE